MVLPLVVVPNAGWATVPACTLIGLLLLATDEVGVQVEEPFSILPLEVGPLEGVVGVVGVGVVVVLVHVFFRNCVGNVYVYRLTCVYFAQHMHICMITIQMHLVVFVLFVSHGSCPMHVPTHTQPPTHPHHPLPPPTGHQCHHHSQHEASCYPGATRRPVGCCTCEHCCCCGKAHPHLLAPSGK